MPPILNQGSSPMCVAYSSSAMKAWQDRRDQERFFDFNEPAFFAAIGGTARDRGYPADVGGLRARQESLNRW